MNPRNGKIARLPSYLLDELNERLESSEEGPQLLAWLNALPDVKRVVREDFAGVPISKQNLSEWRQGGFQEWLVRSDLCEDSQDVRDLADGVVSADAERALVNDVATVLAARFGSLMARWDGEVDRKFEAKTRVLNRLCRSVVQLQRAMHHAKVEALEAALLREEKEKRENEVLKKKLTAPLFNSLKLDSMADLFGGGTAGRKIAKYVLAIQSDRLDSKLDLLPTDEFEKPKPEPGQAEPVKPAENEKSTEGDGDKPLRDNEIEGAAEGEFDQNQSSPVKVNQSDLGAVNKEELGLGLGLGTDEVT